MQILIATLFLATIIGNLARLTFLGAPVTAVDIAILAVLFWATIRFFTTKTHKKTDKINFYAFLTIFFLAFLFISSSISSSLHPDISSLDGIFYTFRWLTLALLPAAFSLCRDHERQNLDKIWRLTIVTLAILGFAQLAILPSFEEIAKTTGWDPHIGRLVSTWLDPNLLGGLFAFSLPIFLARFLRKKDFFTTLSLAIIATALFFTFSRSAWLTAAIAISIFTILRHPRIFFIGLLLATLAISFHPRARSRFTSIFTHDTTGGYRIESWKSGIALWREKPIFGHGPVLRDVRHTRGAHWQATQNSGRGIENSFIFILATGGIVGFSAFLFLLFAALRNLATHSFAHLAGGISLIFHAQFVNSLFFPFLLVLVFWYVTPKLKKSQNCPKKHS